MHRARPVRLLRVPPLARSVFQAPRPPLDLDPSYGELFKNTEVMGALRQRKHQPRTVPELEHSAIPHPDDEVQLDLDGRGMEEMDEFSDLKEGRREERRSAAAVYGSKRVGSVELPFELVNKISNMISDIDKHELRSDAKRLYLSNQTNRWLPTPSNSTKTRQGDREAREGMAHISVGMPAQYSVIENVLREVRNRIGHRNDLGLEGWSPTHMVDFSAGVGSSLWAALQVFQNPDAPEEGSRLPHSTLQTYVAVNQNEGWLQLGKKLQEGVDIGETTIKYTNSYQPDLIPPESLPTTIAISAFTLSQLSSENRRRAFLKSLWATGAEVMVLIDRGTKDGFMHIANARRHLLRYGRHAALAELGQVGPELPDEPKELIIGGATFVEQQQDELPLRARLPDGTNLADLPGLSHVVAPCPHDGACPLHEALISEGGKDFCHFSQRLQRPEFVRLTKHSGWGEEDTPYSYVVVRRGKRPTLAADSDRRGTGRLGGVGKDEVLRERAKRADEPNVVHPGEEIIVGLPDAEEEALSKVMHTDPFALRIEAYEWPRIVYPPIKRSGHVLLDMCTPRGEIERHTITRALGKQPYHDARKASWGDSFPHAPKIPPVVRERGVKRLHKQMREERKEERKERRRLRKLGLLDE